MRKNMHFSINRDVFHPHLLTIVFLACLLITQFATANTSSSSPTLENQTTDLQSIQQLEQTLGKSLKPISLTEINLSSKKSGYVLDVQQQVVGLALNSHQLKAVPEIVFSLKHLRKLSLLNNQIETLPDSIAQLQKLSYLNIKKNRLKQLPEALATVKKLSDLDIRHNTLHELPESLKQLHNLKRLYLGHNQFKTLPAWFAQLDNLNTLGLGYNQFEELPESLGELKQLKRLYLQHNQLHTVPTSIIKLENLKLVRFDFNQITKLPKEILTLNLDILLDSKQISSGIIVGNNNLSSPTPEVIQQGQAAIHSYFEQVQQVAAAQQPTDLEIIQQLEKKIGNKIKEVDELSYRHQDDFYETDGNNHVVSLMLTKKQLPSIPKKIFHLKNLTKLFLQRNQFETLPDAIENLKNLEVLVIFENRLNKLPEKIKELKKLTHLDLGGNQLKALPDAIGRLENLEKLFLSKNKLHQLPKVIGELQKLTHLKLDENKLKTLPDEIGDIGELEVLDVSDNQLSKLPENIGELKKLMNLDLSKNQVKVLPDEIGNLKKLERLEVALNQLIQLPEKIGELQNLEELGLYSNKLKVLPISFSNLTKLKSVKLSSNQFTQIPKEILDLNLDILWGEYTGLAIHVTDNPLTSPPPSVIKQGQRAIYSYLEKTNQNMTSEKKENDLKNLHQLEKAIGKKLQAVNFNAEGYPEKNGYVINKDKQIICLNLDENELYLIPKNVIFFENLKSLSLSRNNIDKLQEFVGEMSALTHLNLQENPLGVGPSKLKNLKNMRNLNLSSTQLREAPYWIEELDHLDKLNLESNEIDTIPVEIFKLNLDILLSSGEFERGILLANNNISCPPEIIQQGQQAINAYLEANSMSKAIVATVYYWLNYLKTPSEEYYTVKGEWPNTLETLGFSPNRSKYIESISIEAKNYSYTIMIKKQLENEFLTKLLGGKTLQLSFDTKTQSWLCSPGKTNPLNTQHLPLSCQP